MSKNRRSTARGHLVTEFLLASALFFVTQYGNRFLQFEKRGRFKITYKNIGDCMQSTDVLLNTTLHPPLSWLDNTFKVIFVIDRLPQN
jgi:hypothetical protein